MFSKYHNMKLNFKCFSLLALLLLIAVPVGAQRRNINFTLSVTLPDGTPATQATATLTQTAYNLGYGTLNLSNNGTVTLKVYQGPHVLEVSQSGYQGVSRTLEINADTAVSVVLAEQTQAPFSLTASVAHNAVTGQNDVTLGWNREPPVFYDDFESYDPFSIEFGDWMGIDGDGLPAAPLVGNYLNRGVRQYAQIINPMQVGWWYDYPVLRPNSGQQYAGFVRTESGAANNDWLISPVVTPGNQNVLSFMAKAADAYKERFQVYVTTVTDNPTTADFTMISSGNYETVDYKVWYSKSYDLSSYAGIPIRFAIRYIGEAASANGAFMLMVDDVSVGQPAGLAAAPARRVAAGSPMNPLESFNVFLDGEQVGSTDGYEYTFANVEAGAHTLGVQAVYPSSASQIVETSIDVSADYVALDVAVAANNGKDLSGEAVQLTTADGSQLSQALIAGGVASFPYLPRGTYLLGVAVAGFETYSGTIDVAADTTIGIELLESIVTPYNITADIEGRDVTVKWNQNISYSDDFESYPDFATDSFGGWTTHDLDGFTTYPISLNGSIINYPGASTVDNPASCPPMVFNPWSTTPSMMPTDVGMTPTSGNKEIVFFSPQSHGANRWILSPPVTVRENFVVRFNAKAYSSYPENLTVNVFAADAIDPIVSSYTQVSSISSLASDAWTIYETDLADYAGQTVRIGINYTSYDAFMAQLDDFYVGNMADDGSLIDVGDVQSYRVSLDGQEQQRVTEPVAVLANVSGGEHTVGISAQYASGMSETATITFTMPLLGDVNADGVVDASDVTALIAAVLGTAGTANADINGDGMTDASDVTALIAIVLGN